MLFTTWEEWLDGPPMPLKQIAPLIICGPQFGNCEFTRAGMCAVQMRGLSVLENWQGLQECGLCQGIENARAVDRLIRLMGLDPATITLAGGSMTLQEFVEWAQGKKSVTLPQGLLDILQKDIPLQPFERVRIPVTAAITLDELQKRWPSVAFDEFIDEMENGALSDFPRPFGVLQKLKDPGTGEIFYQCEYIPPGTQMREKPGQQFIIGYVPPWDARLEAERQERLARWKGGFVYFLDHVEAYEAKNTGLNLIPVDDEPIADTETITDYMKPLEWLQSRWGNIPFSDLAVILWKYGIAPWRISVQPGSLTGFIPESFYTMALSTEAPAAQGTIFHADMHEVEALERDHPAFLRITEEDRRKYAQAIAPRGTGTSQEDSLLHKSNEVQPTIAVPTVQPLPPIAKRVSTAGQGNTQVRNTCRENPEAGSYVEARRTQGATPEEIARELENAGGGAGVIGCLMNPECRDVTAARDHGKYLLKKAK